MVAGATIAGPGDVRFQDVSVALRCGCRRGNRLSVLEERHASGAGRQRLAFQMREYSRSRLGSPSGRAIWGDDMEYNENYEGVAIGVHTSELASGRVAFAVYLDGRLMTAEIDGLDVVSQEVVHPR